MQYINVEHIINDLSFGEKIQKYKLLGFGFEQFSLMNTLARKKRINEKFTMVYQYYLKINVFFYIS